jgi:H+-transporting ATPase
MPLKKRGLSSSALPRVYYRIAMTICIMFVVVLSYLVFGVRPLTAIMIVVLALLDDIPIMTIAYDNVKIAKKPVRWICTESSYSLH